MDPIGQESSPITNLPELSSGPLESAVKQMESAPSEDNLEIANVSDQISKKQLNKNMIIMKVLPGGSIVYERTESGEIVASIVRNNNNNNNNNGVEDVGINSNDSAELENYIKQSAKKALQQQQQAMNNKKKKIQQQQQLLLKASDDQMKKKRKKRIPNSVEGPSRPGLTCPINDRNVENVLDRTLLVTESLQQVLNNFKEDLKRVGGSSTAESKPVGIKKRIEIADKLTNAYVDYQQAIDDIGELGRGYLIADEEDDDEEDDGDEDEVDEEGVDDDDVDDDDDVAAVQASSNYGGGGGIQIEDDVIDEDEEEIRKFIRKNYLKNSKKVNSGNSGKKKVQNLKRVAGTNDEDDEEEEVDELENYARRRVGGVKIEGGQPQVSKGRRKRQRGPDDEDEDFDEVALKKQIYQTKKSKKPPQLQQQQQQQKSKERPDTFSNKKQKKAINTNNNNSSMQNLNNNSINNSSSSSTNKFHDSTPKASTSSKATVTSSSASTTTKLSPSSSHHLNDYYASKKSWTEVDTDGFGQEKSKDTKFWYDSVNVKHEDTTNVSDDLWMSCEPGSDDEVLYNVGFPKISQKRK
ncbi:hypothetical protein HELRODRAFT_194235 [Helobdella robusta]|uniref:Uncharacterized protein n=1 Tax=Helobdella robusta TaxID=6412 RepID=T1FVU4_HELRO|nr:hypothetical protein HELRODRAFT_194235 [Helobdella robusta]ESN92377.1 hypothetical protein HELRODRAFT_194235 [Helobdella robusta]